VEPQSRKTVFLFYYREDVMTTQGRDSDVEIVAKVESKNGKRTADNNPYFEFELVEVGKEFAVTWRQFEGLDQDSVSGQLAREAVPGDVFRFLTFTRPATRGQYHNIREILERVEGGQESSGQSDPFADDPAFDAPNAGTAPAPTTATRTTQRQSNTNPAGFQQEAGRYIAGNSDNSISIERQVSLKAGVDVLAMKVRVVEAVLRAGLGIGDDADPNGLAVLDSYWSWVTQDSPGDGQAAGRISVEVAEWLEYNDGQKRKS
jgi:hypothetical protein